MLNALKSLFSSRQESGPSQKTTDLEARLAPAAGSAGFGEVEFAAYGDGGRKLEVEFAGIGPGEVEVVIGQFTRRITALSGRTELRLSTRQGDDVPECCEGERAELRRMGAVILSGVFRRD